MWSIANTYDNFAKTFSKSRANMKWPEIDYFISLMKKKNLEKANILDIWCGNWRLLNYLQPLFWVLAKNPEADFENPNNLESFKKNFISYIWIDSSAWMINEAKKLFPKYNFRQLDMLEIDKIIETKFDFIFFLASFHHLQDTGSRLEVLWKTREILAKDWMIFMTNWNLLWEKNFAKYKDSYNKNWDFEIKIWDFSRYYHWFRADELEELFTKSDFQILENRIFEWENNIISVLN